MRRSILSWHRWLSLFVAAIWLVQAVTGTLIVFHWEGRDALLSTMHRATELAGIEARIGAIEADGDVKVTSLWTSAGLDDRYALFLSDDRTVHIAGDGTILQTDAPEAGGVFNWLVGTHHVLMAGDTGKWIIGISGALLLSNLLLGLVVAWPKRGTWRRALVPSRAARSAAKTYSFHRAIGLWAVLPAIVLVGTGTMLRFHDELNGALGVEDPVVAAVRPTGAPLIGFDAAVTTAQRVLPGSKLTAVTLPSDKDASYQVRLRAPDELRRAYGTSVVYINGLDGSVIDSFPASAASATEAFSDVLFPLHTGEIAGLIGRLLIMALGLWLTVMIVLGALLWFKRRRPKRA